MNKIPCKVPQGSFGLSSSKFFIVKMRKLRYGPDTVESETQTPLRLGKSMERAGKDNNDVVKLNI